MRHRLERCALLCTVGSLITGCVALLGAEPVPTGRLPTDVRPLHYALELELVPSRDRYSGSVAIAIELDVAANLVKQQLARGRKLLIEIVGTEDRG